MPVPGPQDAATRSRKLDVDLAFIEGDREWELPGHPDHYERIVGVCCREWAVGRYALSASVLRVVRERLGKRPGSEEKLDKLIDVLSPNGATPGGKADAELIRWAGKLGIESPWVEKHSA